MIAIAVATAVKASMDAKAAAATQRKNAMAKQALEREAMLKQRAEQGDAASMEAFEKIRKSRADAAKIKVASGEQGATTGGFQTNAMLQGLGFGTGLQNTADERSANNQLARSDLQMRGSNINFTNTMRTINGNTPTGLDTVFGAAAAGGNAYLAGGAPTPGSGTTTVKARNSTQFATGNLNPRGGV